MRIFSDTKYIGRVACTESMRLIKHLKTNHITSIQSSQHAQHTSIDIFSLCSSIRTLTWIHQIDRRLTVNVEGFCQTWIPQRIRLRIESNEVIVVVAIVIIIFFCSSSLAIFNCCHQNVRAMKNFFPMQSQFFFCLWQFVIFIIRLCVLEIHRLQYNVMKCQISDIECRFESSNICY